MIFGKKGMSLMVNKLIKILLLIFILIVIFYFLKNVFDAGNIFLGMFK